MSNGLGGFLSGAASQYAHLYGDHEYEMMADHGDDGYDEIPGSEGDNYHYGPDECPFWYDKCHCAEVEEVDG